MGCGACKKRAEARSARNVAPGDLFGGYKYLNDRQIKARLEVYKLRFCKNCVTLVTCDYANYLNCQTKQA